MLKNLFGLFQTTTPVKEVKPVRAKQRERSRNTHTLSIHYISAKDFAAFQELKARKKMTTQQLMEEALSNLFILNK